MLKNLLQLNYWEAKDLQVVMEESMRMHWFWHLMKLKEACNIKKESTRFKSLKKRCQAKKINISMFSF